MISPVQSATLLQVATDVILSKPVVLKVRALHKINDPYVSKNLKQEPAIMAKLNHQIIVFLLRIVSVRRLLHTACCLISTLEAISAT